MTADFGDHSDVLKLNSLELKETCSSQFSTNTAHLRAFIKLICKLFIGTKADCGQGTSRDPEGEWTVFTGGPTLLKLQYLKQVLGKNIVFAKGECTR